ncbi:MAG TPA: LysE family translocator [Thermohalobaculum sp.]|nr:LysE family translocator [Thermohalobaculum sp.]
MLVEWTTLLAFAPAALALNLTPGADMMFCLGQGLRGGPRAGMAANLGIAAGSLVHMLAAGLGLAALLATAPQMFHAIRWAGVAYLVFLAVQVLTNPLGATAATSARPASARPTRAFRDAMAVNILNPKVALFILAFLPQFVDPARPVLPQFLILGGVLMAGGLVINGAVGVFAGGLGQALARSARMERGLRYVSAGIFFALAARLALDGRR